MHMHIHVSCVELCVCAMEVSVLKGLPKVKQSTLMYRPPQPWQETLASSWTCAEQQ